MIDESGKWEIRILDNKLIEFRDSSKWRTTYYEYSVIPADILIYKDSRYLLDEVEVPETAIKKAKAMVKKYTRE